ncbi:MAG: YkgJ family cysteine cluster protein [Deltaproteobacteria bacterium]|nr:YkgJ family cysteine cluster protein [Deltaproteobacteria bacterium]
MCELNFNPEACKKCNSLCCNGESGYIWVSKSDIKLISRFLKLSSEKFIKKYLYKKSYNYSIKEVKNDKNFACIFYDDKNNNCSIYSVRPTQCKTYPYWDEIIKNPLLEASFCPGIIIK